MTTTWTTDSPYKTTADVRTALIEESGIRQTIVDRGLRRLNDVFSNGDNTWLVAGHPELSDSFPQYKVVLDGDHYRCSCYGNFYGKSRERILCSHVIAVIAARRLGCTKRMESVEEPVKKEEPARPELTPTDLGLPAKFTSFRKSQLYALERIQASDKKFIILQGSTGVGKTLIAAAAQRLLKTNMLYIPFTKQLQDQFVSDFSHDLQGKRYAVELKGRANYPTLMYPQSFPQINASMCTGKKETHCRWCCDGNCGGGENRCFAKLRCPYTVQKDKALGAELAVLNFDFFANEANFVGRFSNSSPFMCIDEADELEHGLMGFVELSITKRWINRLGILPPAHRTVQDSWVEWAREKAKPAIAQALNALDSAYGVEDIKREQELVRMRAKIDFFLSEAESSKWVFSASDDRWVFKPVFVSRLAERYVWQHSSRFLLMSATIISTDEMSSNLGIPKDEIDFIDLPSTFDPSHRPIYYQPAAAINKRNEGETRPQVIEALDEILDKHPDVKVLCHTVSYSFAAQIMKTSRHKKRMLSYDNASGRVAALEQFKNSGKPMVLVASSMSRGIDLPEDLCRAVVLCKVPYLNLGDKQVAQRLYSDKKGGKLWYAVNTIRTIIQQSGRGVRSEDDFAETYILDGQFEVLFKAWRHLFPEWWRDALRGIK